MNENNKEVNVDEIMEKIREEVNEKYNKLSDISLIKNNPQYQMPMELEQLRFPELVISETLEGDVDGTCHVNNFIKYNNDEFIQKAFSVIYGTSPEQAEIDNLFKRLEKGVTKTYILGRMRYSSRGRKIGARIQGLTLPFLVHSFYRIPIFGHILRMLLILFRLPKTLSDISINLMELSSLHKDLGNHINTFSQIINKDLNAILNKIEVVINQLITLRKSDSSKLNNFLALIKKDFSNIERQLNNLKDEAVSDNQKLDDFSAFIKKELSNINDRFNEFKEEMESSNQLLIPAEMYFELEEKFRGTREDIKKRQKVYLEIIKAADAGKSDSPILDIGCGRGEWLELCTEEELNAFGVDINDFMISQCQKLGLSAVKKNALEYLKSQKNSSIGAVTGFHFIEHITLSELIIFLNETFRVLKPNGIILLETPNPENLLVGACSFYYDPTHLKPIPPKLLEYLLSSCGFARIEVQRININDDFVNRFNSNVDKELVRLFAGAQDYSILGYKN